MSEIKITKDSLENAILKDGQLVFGCAIDGIITSSSSGAFAGGYVYDSEIGAYSLGTFVNGCAVNNDSVNNSSIIAHGRGAHAEGYVDSGVIEASGNGAHAEGYAINSSIISNGKGTFVVGCASTNSIINASVDGGIAMGYAERNSSIISKGYGAFACGYAYKNSIDASGNGAHAEGKNTKATTHYTHAEGQITTASGNASHAEGQKTTASGGSSHAEGACTESSGDYSHTEGSYTVASGKSSHAGGIETIANQNAMTAIGKYNKTYEPADLSTLFVVGDGVNSISTHNAFTVSTSTNYAGYSAQATVNGVSDVYLGCPIGTIVMWAGREAPNGWLLCNGDYIYIEQPASPQENSHIGIEFKNLYDLLNQNSWPYGANKLPDLQQRFPLGAKLGTMRNGYDLENRPILEYTSLGGDGGDSEVALSEYTMPKHKHNVLCTQGVAQVYGQGASFNYLNKSNTTTVTDTSISGGDRPHSNIPPFLAINFIIKYK